MRGGTSIFFLIDLRDIRKKKKTHTHIHKTNTAKNVR